MNTPSPADREPSPEQQFIAIMVLIGTVVFLNCDGVYGCIGLLLAAVSIWIGKQYDRSQVILRRIKRPAASVPRT